VSTTARTSPHEQGAPVLSSRVVGLLAVSCGLAVANLYFNQPLLALIARDFHVRVEQATPISVATQLGYASGLFLIGPLGDRLPRKSLIVGLGCVLTVALLAAASAPSLPLLIAASCLVGLGACLAQQLVPLAAQLAPAERRGRVVGTVMSGLLIGLLGGRMVAGFVGEGLGFRAVFLLGAGLAVLMSLALWLALPAVPPVTDKRYGALLRSTLALGRELPALREAAGEGALLFGAFTVFWVALTPLLTGPGFQLDGRAAGLFGLLGIVGALVAPLAGRLADSRGPRRVVGASIVVVALSFALFLLTERSLWGLAIGTLLLDAGIQGAQIANQARIYALAPEARSRINAFYMTAYFLGGAVGSLLAGLTWARWGWPGAMSAGLLMTLAAGAIHVIRRA
jgi:predicted MFS family arabinose efflux permease